MRTCATKLPRGARVALLVLLFGVTGGMILTGCGGSDDAFNPTLIRTAGVIPTPQPTASPTPTSSPTPTPTASPTPTPTPSGAPGNGALEGTIQ